jgi:hypothetical protein
VRVSSAVSGPVPALIALAAAFLLFQAQAKAQAQTTLAFPGSAAAGYGVRYSLAGPTEAYASAQPLAVEIVTREGGHYWITRPYAAVAGPADGSAAGIAAGTFAATGDVATPNGSIFRFTDRYLADPARGEFAVTRTVEVTQAGPGDAGFSTRFAVQSQAMGTMADFDYFMPSVWYRNNEGVAPTSLAGTLIDTAYWIREDRLPMPLFMLRRKATGASLAVIHIHPEGHTIKDENTAGRIIDARFRFAALGMEDPRRPLVGMLYPGSEGERSYIQGNGKKWVYRNHPVTAAFRQDYALSVRLASEPDFHTALKNAWNRSVELSPPEIYDCDLDKVFDGQIGILDRYWKVRNGTAGFPFRIPMDGIILDSMDYNFDMGFVGMQIPNAGFLLHEGLRSGRPALRQKGERILDFWASQAMTPGGLPKTWFDPVPGGWRPYATYMRTAGDGMLGLLRAWGYADLSGSKKDSWLSACKDFGDWLVAHQDKDGSFPRAVDWATGAVTEASKSNTSHVIPFLAELYAATRDERYKAAALKAGGFIETEIHRKSIYVGGTPDNPDVPDKEAAAMALRAFLALHDLSPGSQWKDAAVQTAYYYLSWVYHWDVPIPQDDAEAIYPKGRGVTGMSAIATGNSGIDTFAGGDAFSFFRLYLMTGDARLKEAARLLLYNTKQAVDWDPDHPVPGYGAQGIMPEAFTLTAARGHGVAYYLPWQTANFLEPMVFFQDVFGSFDMQALDLLPKARLDSLHAEYAATRGYVRSRVSIERGREDAGPSFLFRNARESISIEWFSSDARSVPIRISDIRGKVVYSQMRRCRQGMNVWTLPQFVVSGMDVHYLSLGRHGLAIPPRFVVPPLFAVPPL